MGLIESYSNMVWQLSLAIVVMLVARAILWKVPKKILCILWAVIVFRMLCPFVIEGPIPAFWQGQLSLSDANTLQTDVRKETADMEHITNYPAEGQYHPGMAPGGYDHTFPQIGQEDGDTVHSTSEQLATTQEYDAQVSEHDNEMAGQLDKHNSGALGVKQFWKLFTGVLGYIWAAGAVAMVLMFGIQYVKVYRGLQEAVPLKAWQGKRVRACGAAGLPMVFGLLKPCIYVPFAFEGKEYTRQQELILSHEAAHIRRRDPLFLFLAALGVCIHWWNPLVWVAYGLLRRDVEMACDEAVISLQGRECCKEYAGALLQYSAKRSGLTLTATFAESHTESRIKNILRYKKLPVGVMAIVIALAVVFGICLATNPKSSDSKEGAEREDIVASDTPQKKEDTEVQNPVTQIPVQEDEKQDYQVFYTKLENQHVSRGDVALKQEFMHLSEIVSGEEIPWYRSRLWVDGFVTWLAQEYPQAYEASKDPVNALTLFAGVEGGTADVIEASSIGTYCFVRYTFEDGTGAVYLMRNRGDFWYPGSVQSAESCDWMVRDLDIVNRVTLQDLQAVPFGTEGENVGSWQGPSSDNLSDYFRRLVSIPREEVYLYGMWGGDYLIFQKGSAFYPIQLFWETPHGSCPELYSGDYDGDGEIEYALIKLEGTGTGYHTYGLYILEPEEEELKLYSFDFVDMMTQLETVYYKVSPTNRYVEIGTNTGTYPGSSCFVNYESFLDSYGDEEQKFTGICFSDIYSFEEMNGNIGLTLQAGLQFDNLAMVHYENSAVISAMVHYDGRGGFSLGDISMEAQYFSVEQKPAHDDLIMPEKVIAEIDKDLIQDGLADRIVVSVTLGGGEDGEAERLLAGGECLYVRVYSSEELLGTRSEEYALYGGYPVPGARWEKMLALAHSGNGQVYFVEKDEKQYLMTVSNWQGQGELSYSYMVQQLGRDSAYLVDYKEYLGDSSFGYTQKQGYKEYMSALEEWLGCSKLIASTDVEAGVALWEE